MKSKRRVAPGHPKRSVRTVTGRPDKDGVSLIKADGIANAYPDDIRAYFKFGIYKWWWQERPSAVTERTIFWKCALNIEAMARRA